MSYEETECYANNAAQCITKAERASNARPYIIAYGLINIAQAIVHAALITKGR